MNATELAKAMLEYGELHARLNALGVQIENAVGELKSTQRVGKTTASFRKGKKTYDYETAAAESPLVTNEVLAAYTATETITKTDYTALCKALKIKAPFTEGKPSVKITVED